MGPAPLHIGWLANRLHGPKQPPHKLGLDVDLGAGSRQTSSDFGFTCGPGQIREHRLELCYDIVRRLSRKCPALDDQLALVGIDRRRGASLDRARVKGAMTQERVWIPR